MLIAGIDGSLTSTGLARLNTESMEVEYDYVPTFDLRGVQRLIYIRDSMSTWIQKVKPNYCALEGYAMGAKGRAFDIGEGGGVLKVVMHLYNPLTSIIVAPKSMKKFITGNGNATKTQVQEQLLLKWNLDIGQEDAADAAGLALFYYYVLNKRKQRQLTKDQKEALKKYENLI